MTTPVFMDTSFLIALLLIEDEYHERAVAWKKVVKGQVVTTEYVLVEFADAFCAEHLRQRAVAAVTTLRADPDVRIVEASTERMEEGLDFFKTHADKRWSLTDCVSFVVMRAEKVMDALTSDRHFEQAGFRALLRMEPSNE